MKSLAVVLFLAAAVMPATTSAVLQSVSHPTYGPDSITRDTDTGLEWLDLTHSYNQTFVYVASQFGPGQAYDGFRHATSDEVKLYWEHGGISVGTGWSSANYTPCRDFQLMVGHSELGPDFWQSVGLTVESPGPGFRNMAYINTNTSSDPDVGAAESSGAYDSDSTSGPGLGHWLVRSMPPVGVQATTWTAIRHLYR